MTVPSHISGKPGDKGITRIYKAAGYSIQGLRCAFKFESAFRQDLALSVIGTALLPFIHADISQKLLMWSVLMLLLVVELLNSALEAVVDRISCEKHPLSGQAKDMGSAAVMICLLLCAGVWGVVLCQHL